MSRSNPSDYAAYLQSVVRLDALEKMTQNLDKELADSQRIMQEIKAIFDSVPTAQTMSHSVNNPLRHEDLSRFLEADVPKLLLPDMVENTADVDLDDIIKKMKSYAEELKKNFVLKQPQIQDKLNINKMSELELEQYATSLDQLGKRLANIKLVKNDENNKNTDLEEKLTKLCQDVNMFTQMVQAKTILSECNKNWTETSQENNALHYDNVINKLLSGINEVMYLLQNKN
ncbi:uncharacterized protein LOC113522770 [Galleria mellonella]|uniref:Uncharacterized protein LOC113522770 n=1 Tax=Galleria mellonella TaxID=7137 RepID=A0A6J1X901_GALME|nr:uncharacterized protein LOC113522770 [Galleria mellonella]